MSGATTREDVRAWAARMGMVEVTGVPADPPFVGDQAIVYGRGGWRLGTITKVGRTTIYVAVTTPTSPDLVTTARIGGRWRERGYIKPRRKPLRSPTREERQSMDDAHAQGWHDEFPREFCPTCEETR